MKNKWRAVACCLVIMLLCALAGCRLAQEGKVTEATEDRLVGVLVTTEYLDLFDMERYLNDNIGNNPDGEITIDGSAREYQGRLYAILKKETLTDEKAGQTTEIVQFVFEGIKGIPYFAADIPKTAERESFLSSSSDEAISDGHTGIKSGDKENSLTLEGTIYIAPSGLETYYINPVYQSDDGRVYVTSGSGFSTDSTQNEGTLFSQTMSFERTVTENGKAVKDSTSVKISLHMMQAPKKIVLLEMDRGSAVLSRTECMPGEVPDAITPKAGTEYILVETHKTDSEGKPLVTRTLFGKDAQTLETFYSREDGVCVKQWTALNWVK